MLGIFANNVVRSEVNALHMGYLVRAGVPTRDATFCVYRTVYCHIISGVQPEIMCRGADPSAGVARVGAPAPTGVESGEGCPLPS